jgi:hypothetical protein
VTLGIYRPRCFPVRSHAAKRAKEGKEEGREEGREGGREGGRNRSISRGPSSYLSAIPMVHIIVDDGHALQPLLDPGVHRPQSHVVEETKAHPSVFFGMVPRGSDQTVSVSDFVARFRPTRDHRVDGVQHPAHCQTGNFVRSRAKSGKIPRFSSLGSTQTLDLAHVLQGVETGEFLHAGQARGDADQAGGSRDGGDRNGDGQGRHGTYKGDKMECGGWTGEGIKRRDRAMEGSEMGYAYTCA